MQRTVVSEVTWEAVPFGALGGHVPFRGGGQRALGLAVGGVMRVRYVGNKASAGVRVIEVQHDAG